MNNCWAYFKKVAIQFYGEIFKNDKAKLHSGISSAAHPAKWSLWMPKLEITKATSLFKKCMQVETVIVVTAVHILCLEHDFDASLDEGIYSSDKTASRMTTALLR